MLYFPMFYDISEATILIVGAGNVALAKLESVLEFTDNVALLAPTIKPPLEALVQRKQLRFIRSEFSPVCLQGYDIIIAATNNGDVNAAVATEAKRLGKPVNVVDVPALSSFIFGATIKAGRIVISVSTSGLAPVLARLIKQSILRVLPRHIMGYNEFLIRNQGKVRERLPGMQARRLFWQEAFEGAVGLALNEDAQDRAQQALEDLLENRDNQRRSAVYVIGGIPDDAELLTLRALRLLSLADVVLYDDAGHEGTLAYARRDALKMDCSDCMQEASSMVMHYAREKKIVVLLVSGDPCRSSVTESLRETAWQANIAFTMVPGVALMSRGVTT